MTARIYLRRSKNDEGKQQFSLDVQRSGAREFLQRLDAGCDDVVEYMDDGKAGDDFHSRTGLRALLADTMAGDVVVCRDQSRLGRDAIEVTLVIRDLVQERACQLYYYVSGQKVQFANAIDQATTFIQGTGHQMELEAIRSRTREALRSRVREGRIAGGACYGYDLVRKEDATGRGFTIAVVNEEQAEVVRHIYREYLAGIGTKGLAHELNRNGVPCPTRGRRGTGSWAPSGIRAMLLNPRYRGVYIHGRLKNVRRGGKRVKMKADPSEIISIGVPEWQIVDDELWFAVQDVFASRVPRKKLGATTAKYPLTGLARCATCGGAIACGTTNRKGQKVKAYSCSTFIHRGKEVCSVSVRQPMEEVEEALIRHIESDLLSVEAQEALLQQTRAALLARLPAEDTNVGALEEQLEQVRTEQRRLARAVALSDEISELVSC